MRFASIVPAAMLLLAACSSAAAAPVTATVRGTISSISDPNGVYSPATVGQAFTLSVSFDDATAHHEQSTLDPANMYHAMFSRPLAGATEHAVAVSLVIGGEEYFQAPRDASHEIITGSYHYWKTGATRVSGDFSESVTVDIGDPSLPGGLDFSGLPAFVGSPEWGKLTLQRIDPSFFLYSTLYGTVNEFSFRRQQAASVPEAGSVALLGLSFLALAAVRRARREKSGRR